MLKTLVAVADADTFSAAAQEIHITHAAVSQQMQTLEADLDVTLFNRQGRTPILTPLGRQVVVRARKLIADYENLVPSILNDGGLQGVIKLGAIGTTLTGLTPRAMATLKSRFPDVGLHIRPGLTSALLADIERGNLDAVIITKPHLLPVGIVFRALAEEPLELIASDAIDEDEPYHLLATHPYIRFNRNAVLGTLIDNWLTQRRLKVVEAMELDSAEAITSMVQANLGVSIVPRLAVCAQPSSGIKRICLGSDAPLRTLGLAYHEDQIKTQAVDAVFDALRAVISDTSAGV